MIPLILLLISPSLAYIEFCYEGKLHKVRASSCEGGFLFREPQDLPCAYPKDVSFTTDICTGEIYNPDTSGGPLPKFQYVKLEDDDNEPADGDPESCSKTCAGEVVEVTPEIAPIPDTGGEVPFSDSEETDNEVAGVIVDDPHVRDQTERLFLYLAGLLVDEGENGPNTRVANVMRMSFAILRKHCPNQFVSENFATQLEKSFFFLLREGDLSPVKDLPDEDYNEIKRALEKCAHAIPTPFELGGHICQTKSVVHNISSNQIDLKVPYKRTSDSFQFGVYDPPVDAAWSVGDFVHGLCYGKFSENVNKHHQFEVAMESLFTQELIYRWERPFKLTFSDAWNHMLQTDMKETMRNLDACVQGAYLGSPFLSRLKRPLRGENQARRKKRQADYDDDDRVDGDQGDGNGELKGKAYCFQTMEESSETIDSIKRNCPAPSP